VEGSKTFNLPGERKLSLTPAYDHNTKAFELSVAQVCVYFYGWLRLLIWG
jgi:hypothetical protein